jgi:hypothetical protein
MLPVLAVVALAVISPRTLWTTTDGGDVASSLERASPGYAFAEPCIRRGPRMWTCRYERDPGSGTAGGYRVVLGEDGCWRASSPSPEDDVLRGCLDVVDYALGWVIRL